MHFRQPLVYLISTHHPPHSTPTKYFTEHLDQSISKGYVLYSD